MKFNRLAKLGLVAAFSAIALAACGSKSTSSSMASKQVLNWNETSELPTMDL